MHCFCVCGSDALLGGLLQMSKSMGLEVLSVLSYCSFLLSVFVMHCICIRATLIAFAIFRF